MLIGFFFNYLSVLPRVQLSSSSHSRRDSPGWDLLRSTLDKPDWSCCPRSLSTLRRWPADGQSCYQLNYWKWKLPLLPDLSPCPLVCKEMIQSVLTAPQDLQWCLRLVKLKLSLQPLHVCFSLSFFLELFWKKNQINKTGLEKTEIKTYSPKIKNRTFIFVKLNQITKFLNLKSWATRPSGAIWG